MSQTDEVGCVRRLYGLMQSLMSSRAGGEVDWDAGPARGIVTQVDAVEAVIQVAAAIDETLQTGQVRRERLEFAGAALMVVREHVRTLPYASSPHGGDAVGDDLREMVEAMREYFGHPDD